MEEERVDDQQSGECLLTKSDVEGCEWVRCRATPADAKTSGGYILD